MTRFLNVLIGDNVIGQFFRILLVLVVLVVLGYMFGWK